MKVESATGEADSDRHTIADARRSVSNRTRSNHHDTKPLRHELRKQTTMKRLAILGLCLCAFVSWCFYFAMTSKLASSALLSAELFPTMMLKTPGSTTNRIS